MKRLIDLILVAFPLMFCGCQDDDVFEIFASGQWRVVNYYVEADWNATYDNHAKALYTPTSDELRNLQDFTITFNEDGSLTGYLDNQSFTGRWSANPKDRSVSITQLSVSSANLSGMRRDFIQKLENVRYYRGDSRTLQLAPESRNNFVQFTHY